MVIQIDALLITFQSLNLWCVYIDSFGHCQGIINKYNKANYPPKFSKESSKFVTSCQSTLNKGVFFLEGSHILFLGGFWFRGWKMSAAVSSTTSHLEEELKNNNNNNNVGGESDQPPYNEGANSDVAEETEPEEDDDSKLESNKELDLGPQFTLKEQLEKDKVRFSFFLLFFKCFFKPFGFAAAFWWKPFSFVFKGWCKFEKMEGATSGKCWHVCRWKWYLFFSSTPSVVSLSLFFFLFL